MPAWIRRTAMLLGLLALALAAGAFWLARDFEPDRYKALAIDWMKANHNRTLEINGPITLSVFPRLQVRLASVSLSEVGRPYSSATLDEALLGVELLPLLRGTLVVDRIEAQGVRLHWLRAPDGVGNFDDLWQRGDAQRAVEPAMQFDIRRITVADVQMRVRDEVAGIDGVLDLKELSTGRIAHQIESKIELLAQFGLKTPALKGELSGSTRFTPDLQNHSLRLAGMNLEYKGDAPGASSIDATLRGALAWNSRNNALDGQALILRMTANAAGIKFNDSSLTMDRFALDATNKSYSISKLKLRLLGTQAGKPLDLLLDWPELDVSGNELKGSALTGRLSLGGALPLQASFRSDAPIGSFDAVRVPAFVAQVHGSAAARKLDALLRSELVLQPEKRTVLLEKSELQLQFDGPGLRPLSIGLNGAGTVSGGNAKWSVAGQLNGNGFKSEGAASFSGITPNLKAQVRFDTLDIDSLLAPAAAVSAGSAADAPIDLAALRLVDGSFIVRIGSLISRRYRIGDAHLDATLDAGMLRVPSMGGTIWGGEVAGSAFADARASRLALKAVANGVDIKALLRDLADKDVLEGRGSMSVDVDTAGRTFGELRSRLRGSATMHLREGAVSGIDLAHSLRHSKAAMAQKQDAAFKASKAQKTAFSEMQASFRINDGVVRSTDLQLRSPLMRIGGEGSLDLAQGRIDCSARTTLADSAKAPMAADWSDLKGVTVPVALNGAFDSIVWKIQWSNMVIDTTRQRPDQKPRAAPKAATPGAAADDGLKNKLRG